MKTLARAIGMTLVGGLLLAGCNAHAESRSSSSNVATAEFKNKLAQIDGQAREVERLFSAAATRIESSRRIAAQDLQAAELERAMEAYAAALKSSFDEAVAAVEQATQSNGRSGNTGNLVAFETLAKTHERRMKALQTRGTNIETQVKSGRVIIDRAILEQFTPAEREQFGDFLNPAARKAYPAELVPGQRSSFEFEPLMRAAGSHAVFASALSGLKGCGNWIANSIIGSAEAAVSAVCVATCAVGS